MTNCLHCDKETANPKFCSKSCSAAYTNARKNYSTFKPGPVKGCKTSIPVCSCISCQAILTTNLLKRHNCCKSKIISQKSTFKKIVENATGKYTRVFLCTCKITGIKWYSKTVKTIHPSVVKTKKDYSYQSRFNFAFSKFPEWFDYSNELIKEYGWYSASNRKNNSSGCSRDHMYSVSDGFKNHISPKIISHPANCKIIPHRENQHKHSKSVITIEELLIRIKEFEMLYGVQDQI